MKVTIFGTGYVGLVTGACLAEVGHQVTCMDVDVNKIDRLRDGIIPIYEPGLESIVKSNIKSGNLVFTSNAQEAVASSEIQYIAVGTPPDSDGSADLQHVLAVAETIATFMTEDQVIVNKSTVPVGTAEKVRAKISAALKNRNVEFKFSVISNPEFLKEGAAVNDGMRPDRIIVGIDEQGQERSDLESKMRELYAPFSRNHNKIIFMDVRSAELTKYAANCMLATKISFMNEMANIAEIVGADIEHVRHGIGSDPRIGYHFIYPGCGYGGSCFPKDVKALIKTSENMGYQTQILQSVENVNERQKHKLFESICKHYGCDPDSPGNTLSGKTIAVWGLAFKPKTDDMREAPSRYLMEALWSAGAKVQAYDPEAMDECQRIYGNKEGLMLMGTPTSALYKANALVIVTEWQNFRAPDFALFKEHLIDQVIFDGRNLYEPKKMGELGLAYYGIGRGLSGRGASE